MTDNQNNFTSRFLDSKFEELLCLLVELTQQRMDSTAKLPIMTQHELLEKLSISPNTLKSWERSGLKRLEPPIEGCRTIYYKIDDVLAFLTN